MPTLNFSFQGESINAAKLESKVEKFDLQFEKSLNNRHDNKVTFSIEHFYSINRYAENLCEAFHLAAIEAGVTIQKLAIHIVGNLDSTKVNAANSEGSVFNKIDVALIIVSEASDLILEKVLSFAQELNPIDANIQKQIDFNFSLNSIVHLN